MPNLTLKVGSFYLPIKRCAFDVDCSLFFSPKSILKYGYLGTSNDHFYTKTQLKYDVPSLFKSTSDLFNRRVIIQ